MFACEIQADQYLIKKGDKSFTFLILSIFLTNLTNSEGEDRPGIRGRVHQTSRARPAHRRAPAPVPAAPQDEFQGEDTARALGHETRDLRQHRQAAHRLK